LFCEFFNFVLFLTFVVQRLFLFWLRANALGSLWLKFFLLFLRGDPLDFAAAVVGDQKRAVRRYGDSDRAAVGFVL
jgi:hypothetical protein